MLSDSFTLYIQIHRDLHMYKYMCISMCCVHYKYYIQNKNGFTIIHLLNLIYKIKLNFSIHIYRLLMENEQYVIHFHNHKLLSRMQVATFSDIDADESYPI